jgi:hypothetical protein
VWTITHQEMEPTVASKDVKRQRARFDLGREGRGMATVRILWDAACQEEPSLEAGQRHLELFLTREERPGSTLYVGRDGIARASEQGESE